MDIKTTSSRALFLGLAALLAPALASSAHAQVPDTIRRDTVYRLEPIAVRSIRPSTTAGGVSALEVRLDSVRFRAAPLLEDVLRELPLVQVRTNSRGEAQIALRGAEERQIAILLDGVPLTLGWDHRTDLSVVPLTAARSIRLIRGMSSVLHGPNVLGGVVEIGLAGAEPEALRVALGVESPGGYSAGVVTGTGVEAGRGRFTVQAGAGRRERTGFAAPADAAPFYPSLADARVRVNSDLVHTDGFLSGRYASDGGPWASISATGFSSERGVPPELNTDGPRLWRYPESDRMVAILAAGTGELDGSRSSQLDVNVGLDLGSTRIENYALPGAAADPALAPDDFYETVDEVESSDDRTLTTRVVGARRIGRATVRAAGTYADIIHDEVVLTDVDTPMPGTVPAGYRQRLWSLGAELDLPFGLPSSLPLSGGRVSAGFALDAADTPETGDPGIEGRDMSAWGGRLGVSVTTGQGGLLLHTAVSRRGRFPALREMYSTALGRFQPNPGLRPEILSAVEAGFTTRVGGYDLQVVGFHQRLEDAIVRGAPPAGSTARFQRMNRDEIRSTGLELLTGYTMGRLALESEVTLQDVDVVAPGSAGIRAEYEPELAGGIGASVPVVLGIEAGAEVEYLGRQYCSAPVPGQEVYETIPASTRADVQLARSFRLTVPRASFDHLGLELAVDNLTDSLSYDQCGLPRPGRSLRLQVRLN